MEIVEDSDVLLAWNALGDFALHRTEVSLTCPIPSFLLVEYFFHFYLTHGRHYASSGGVQEGKAMKHKIILSVMLFASLPGFCLCQTANAPLNHAEILGRLASGSSRSYVAHLVNPRCQFQFECVLPIP
jgi:hypothetical protein